MAQNKDNFEITRTDDGSILLTMSHPKAPSSQSVALLNPAGRILMLDMGEGEFLAFPRLQIQDVSQMASSREIRVAVEISREESSWVTVTLPLRVHRT